MATILDAQGRVYVSRGKPQPTPDQGPTSTALARGGRYGETAVNGFVPTKHLLADEGSYFLTTNPTPSTLIAYGSAGTQATFTDTTGFLILKNNASPASGIRAYLDYLKILVGGTVPAAATSTQWAAKIDMAGKDRTPSAGFSLLTPVNVNGDDGTPSQVQVWAPNAAVPTVPASSGSARLVGRGTLKVGISVTLEEYILAFGAVDGVALTSGGFSDRAAPLILGPQEFGVIALWQPSATTNALSVEFELGHWER